MADLQSQGAIIQVEAVEHTYPNGVKALRGANLTICPGEYIAIVGQNGSGKTTLAKHLNGLLRPTAGRVLVEGRDALQSHVSQLSRVVGYVFQNPDDMLFCSSVEEEVAFGLKMVGFSDRQIRQRVEESLERLGLVELREQHPFTLSLGDRQRAAVACVLALAPKVFVFDEPTTGQDHFGGQSIMETIDRLHADGTTILMITHDMQLVAEHARRVIVMSEGRIALDGRPGEAFVHLDLLESLSLRPPQCTRLAQLLGRQGEAILTVEQFCNWMVEKSRANKFAATKGTKSTCVDFLYE